MTRMMTRASVASPSAERRALTIANRLRKYHALGCSSLASDLSGVAFAAQHRLSVFFVYKIRIFAKAYSSRDLDRLCKLRRADGLALHFGHVNVLTGVPKRDRPRFEREIADNNWTAPRAHAEFKARYGKKREWGGRPVTLPPDRAEALRQAIDGAGAWQRKYRGLAAELRSGRRLPQSLRRDAIVSLDQLIQVARQLRGQLSAP